jgi:hypothetical protein
MAEERTLGIARAQDRARDNWGDEPSKEELQRRMDEARDSITNTVSEIKENVAQQVETVKDALDWREHFKKSPVAWSLGAAGVGFFVGYGIAACVRGESDDYNAGGPTTYERLYGDQVRTPAIPAIQGNGENDGPGMLERFKETSAYERLSREAGTLGDRFIEELSTTAQAVVLPLLLNKIKGWIGVDLSEKTPSMSAHREADRRPLEASLSTVR